MKILILFIFLLSWNFAKADQCSDKNVTLQCQAIYLLQDGDPNFVAPFYVKSQSFSVRLSMNSQGGDSDLCFAEISFRDSFSGLRFYSYLDESLDLYITSSNMTGTTHFPDLKSGMAKGKAASAIYRLYSSVQFNDKPMTLVSVEYACKVF